jgi:hypothetical protein
MHKAYFKQWASGILKRTSITRYRNLIPTGTGSGLDEYLVKCYGEIRRNGETDDDYRDRVTQPPVTECHEIHNIIGYDA